MRALRYSDRKAFWEMVHQAGPPHIRLNSRRILFPKAAFIDWIASRTVGSGAGIPGKAA